MIPHPQFPNPLAIRVLPRWEIWSGQDPRRCQLYEVLSPFIFKSEVHGDIIVPINFITDFGSVPSVTKWYVDDDDPDLLYGSLPHDYLYAKQGDLGEGRKLTRLEADNLLREAMLACGSGARKVQSVYWAVRNFGGGHWREP